MGYKLVIVESPTKTKTISSILGKNYKVVASMGHIIDLPKNRLGVKIEDNDISINYIKIPEKKETITKLKKEIIGADEIYLATDPDREGEAIAYHIASLAKDKKFIRILINEITAYGIKNGMDHQTTINEKLFCAQQARRILDRIVGYKLSPFLWQKVKKGLSAGRVQSVALRMLCEREDKVKKFISEKYWEIFSIFDLSDTRFKLENINKKKAKIESKKECDGIVNELKGYEKFYVSKANKTEKKVASPPPFITSTLQQAASKNYGWSPKRTMRIAQMLYEGIKVGGQSVGLITYMRTDSIRISDNAKFDAQNYIASEFGKSYINRKSKIRKSSKKIQDAHEAIRPTHIDKSPKAVEKSLAFDQRKLYELIFNRFLASQMSDGIDTVQTIKISSTDDKYLFQNVIRNIKFDGFRILYKQKEEKEGFLTVTEGVSTQLKKIFPEEKETKPPARYTSGTLIKQLEEKGIGRPSTYATIVSTLIDRKYVNVVERALIPCELGMIVSDFLVRGFPEILDYNFTKDLEKKLDKIALGELEYKKTVIDIWNLLLKLLEKAKSSIDSIKEDLLEKVGRKCPLCGGVLVYRDGKFGKFISCLNYPNCKYTENIIEKSEIKCSKCGTGMEVRVGKWGKYLKCPNEKCGYSMGFSSGLKCPKCSGFILEKISKKKRKYYICENNNSKADIKCDFLIFYPPIEGKCNKCSSTIMVKYGKKYKCSLCGNVQENLK